MVDGRRGEVAVEEEGEEEGDSVNVEDGCGGRSSLGSDDGDGGVDDDAEVEPRPPSRIRRLSLEPDS